MNLTDYILAHTARDECQCGRCLDRGNAPDPTGHVVDVGFFKVGATNSPTDAVLRELVGAHQGVFNDVNPYDGNPHSYMELGGWLGDQGLALQFMGLSALLGIAAVLVVHGEPVLVPNALAELVNR